MKALTRSLQWMGGMAILACSTAVQAIPTSVISNHPCAAAALHAPIGFEANMGQLDGSIRYLGRGPGYAVELTSGEALLGLRKPSRPVSDADVGDDHGLRISFVGARTDVVPRGEDRLSGDTNYFSGDDTSRWHTHVPR